MKAQLLGSVVLAFLVAAPFFLHDCLAQDIGFFDLNECGRSVGCWRKPEDCTGPDNCIFAVSYTDLVVGQRRRRRRRQIGEDVVRIKIYSKMSVSDDWIGFGLSNDQQMGQDSVVECVRHANGPINGTAGVYLSYNPAQYNSRITELPKEQFVAVTSVAFADGAVYCEFERVKFSRNPKVFSLYGREDGYYLFLARGPANQQDGALMPHKLPGDPDAFLFISPTKVDLKFNEYDPRPCTTSQRRQILALGQLLWSCQFQQSACNAAAAAGVCTRRQIDQMMLFGEKIWNWSSSCGIC